MNAFDCRYNAFKNHRDFGHGQHIGFFQKLRLEYLLFASNSRCELIHRGAELCRRSDNLRYAQTQIFWLFAYLSAKWRRRLEL
jgi:hypothetical protein